MRRTDHLDGAHTEWRVFQLDVRPYGETGRRHGEHAVDMRDEEEALARQDVLDAMFADGVRRIQVVRVESREVGPWTEQGPVESVE